MVICTKIYLVIENFVETLQKPCWFRVDRFKYSLNFKNITSDQIVITRITSENDKSVATWALNQNYIKLSLDLTFKIRFEIEIFFKRQQLRRCNCRLPMPFQCDFQCEISLLWKSSKISSFGMSSSRDESPLSDTILASDVILWIWRVVVLSWTCLDLPNWT